MIWTSIVSLLAALAKGVATYIGLARDRLLIALGATQERAKINEASSATQEAIKEVADERSAVPDAATDPDDLAREFRSQMDGKPSGRKRPF
jgi:hypothetical protein